MNPNFLQTSTGTGEKTKSKSGSVQRFGPDILSRSYTAVLPENIQYSVCVCVLCRSLILSVETQLNGTVF